MSANKTKIMLVDDDQVIIEALSYNLERHDYSVISFARGIEALSGFDTVSPDLVVLDWMLPDIPGPEILKLIRERDTELPVLMLTGRAAPTDVAHGLACGADDYLAKPFSPIEFMARIQALLRRARKNRENEREIVALGPLHMDISARKVMWRDRAIDLSPREFALLKVLMLNADKTLTTDMLLAKVWGADFTGDVKTVAVHMRWLRQKLEDDPKNPRLLETVQRSGYRLNSPIQLEGRSH